MSLLCSLDMEMTPAALFEDLINNDCVIFDGEQTAQARLIDISIKGALIELTRESPSLLVKPFELKIDLEEGAAKINLQCRAVHRAARRVGLYFTRTDVESLTHLRRLISLNSGDAEKTLDELFLWSTADSEGAEDESTLTDSNSGE